MKKTWKEIYKDKNIGLYTASKDITLQLEEVGTSMGDLIFNKLGKTDNSEVIFKFFKIKPENHTQEDHSLDYDFLRIKHRFGWRKTGTNIQHLQSYFNVTGDGENQRHKAIKKQMIKDNLKNILIRFYYENII